MINKKNLWFLTLFSLVLVLSIYYVTMPNEVFDKDLSNKESETTSTEINTDKSVSIEEKNNYFEELKLINKNSSKEETIETKIKEMCSCDNFVKIDGDNVRVVLDSDDSNTSKANEIMRLVQKEFDNKMYISVKFN